MADLIKGFEKFHQDIYQHKQELFKKLAITKNRRRYLSHVRIHGLIRTCSRKRSPEICLSCEMREIWFHRMRRASVAPRLRLNSVSRYYKSKLQVKEIMVCGHADCGAMKALMRPESFQDLPAVREWLRMAESTRQIVREMYPALKGEELFAATIKENVLVQLEHLRTHPAVAKRLRMGDLKLHGWMYSIATGEVWLYDPHREKFVFPKEVKNA